MRFFVFFVASRCTLTFALHCLCCLSKLGLTHGRTQIFAVRFSWNGEHRSCSFRYAIDDFCAIATPTLRLCCSCNLHLLGVASNDVTGASFGRSSKLSFAQFTPKVVSSFDEARSGLFGQHFDKFVEMLAFTGGDVQFAIRHVSTRPLLTEGLKKPTL